MNNFAWELFTFNQYQDRNERENNKNECNMID